MSQPTTSTSAELERLGQLASSTSMCLPDTERILRTIQDNFVSSWVRNFLLSESPIHVEYMLSPLMPSTSLLRSCNIATAEFGAVPPRASPLHEQLRYQGHDLYVPVYSDAEVTAGIGVVDISIPAQSGVVPVSTNCNRLKHNFRFALNTKTSTLLKVFDFKDDDMIGIESLILTSPTQTLFSRAFFPRNTLRQVNQEASVTLNHLQPCLLVAREGVHEHDCTTCGVSKFRPNTCSCKLDLVSPRTHQDYVSNGFSYNMSFFATSSSSVTTTSFTDRGRSFKHTTERYSQTGCFANISRKHDNTIFLNMCAWSIWDFAQNRLENPRQSRPLLATEVSACSQSLLASSGALTPTPLQAQLSERMASAGDQPVESQGMSSEQIREGDTVRMVYSQTATDRVSTPVSAGTNYSLNLRQYESSSTAYSRGLTTAQDSTRSERSAVPYSAGTSERTEEFSDRDHKLAMEERRKERNRAAARRSKLKKRIQYDKLEADLNANREKIDRLRTVELRLRRENMELRSRVQGESSKEFQ